MINVHSLKLPDVTQGKGIKTTRRFEGPFEVIDKLSDITYCQPLGTMGTKVLFYLMNQKLARNSPWFVYWCPFTQCIL